MVNHSNGGSIMERKGFRSLICDEEGVIIGEMVYRCLICSFISESMEKVRNHYQNEHVDIDDSLNGRYLGSNGDYCLSPANSCDQNLCDDSNAPGTVADDPEDEVRSSGEFSRLAFEFVIFLVSFFSSPTLQVVDLFELHFLYCMFVCMCVEKEEWLRFFQENNRLNLATSILPAKPVLI